MGPSRMFLSKPVIAAVAGYAVAGGLELALWCDLRIVERDAVFGVFCRRWGVPLIDGGTIRLPRLIGLSRALDLILTGRPVGAEEALQIGLANRVVETGMARPAAEALAGLGQVIWLRKKTREAVSYYQKAIDSDPETLLYRQQLIAIFKSTGQNEAEKKALTEMHYIERKSSSKRVSPSNQTTGGALWP